MTIWFNFNLFTYIIVTERTERTARRSGRHRPRTLIGRRRAPARRRCSVATRTRAAGTGLRGAVETNAASLQDGV